MTTSGFRHLSTRLTLEQIRVRAQHIANMAQEAIDKLNAQPGMLYGAALEEAFRAAREESRTIEDLVKIEGRSKAGEEA